MHTTDDLIVLAKTIYGEARGENKPGKYAVALVIHNRWKKIIKKKPKTQIKDVCLAPYQFSCWNKNDTNYKVLSTDDSDINKKGFHDRLMEALYVLCVHELDDDDITNGATHYHTYNILPYWAKGKEPCAKIGNHWFYNNID